MQQAYALVGRSYPSDEFKLLFQASEDARARRRAMMRSSDGRAGRGSASSSARWRVGREPVAMPVTMPVAMPARLGR